VGACVMRSLAARLGNTPTPASYPRTSPPARSLSYGFERGLTVVRHLFLVLDTQVPYMEDTGLQKRRHDIWTTSAELLHLAGGDFEEHAHLLAGYFMQLGLEV
jgi:hypothetical protein